MLGNAATLLFLFMIGSVLAAIPLAFVMLFVIRARVRCLMRTRTRSPSIMTPAVERQAAAPLQLANVDAPATPLRPAAQALFRRMSDVRHRAAAAYSLGAFAAATVLAVATGTAGTLTFDTDTELTSTILATGWVRGHLLLTHLWPVFLTVLIVAMSSFRSRLWTLTLVVVVMLVETAVVLLLTGNAEHYVPFAVYASLPTILLLLAANRWLKTIAPLVALIVLVAFCAYALGSEGPWIGLRVTALLAVGLYGVHLLVRAYERKFFGELSFQLAFLWISFTLNFTMMEIDLRKAGTPIWWCGPLSLALYAAVTSTALLLLRRAERMHPPVSLLVLRVFGAPSRSQRLFEELGTRWRYVGPLHDIAGADSAIANLDMSEAFHFLTFRFRSLYVRDAADLEERLAVLDCAPDPDGRYRINDFFCFDDTWKKTFTGLLRRSDVVLVDLSGYGPRNAGVAFELGHLLGSRPLNSFVLVTDDQTDIDYLCATLTRLWRELDPSTPNAGLEDPLVRVMHKPEPRKLVAALCDAAIAGGWRDELPESVRRPFPYNPLVPFIERELDGQSEPS